MRDCIIRQGDDHRPSVLLSFNDTRKVSDVTPVLKERLLDSVRSVNTMDLSMASVAERCICESVTIVHCETRL